jgi:hypothetical protein
VFQCWYVWDLGKLLIIGCGESFDEMWEIRRHKMFCQRQREGELDRSLPLNPTLPNASASIGTQASLSHDTTPRMPQHATLFVTNADRTARLMPIHPPVVGSLHSAPGNKPSLARPPSVTGTKPIQSYFSPSSPPKVPPSETHPSLQIGVNLVQHLQRPPDALAVDVSRNASSTSKRHLSANADGTKSDSRRPEKKMRLDSPLPDTLPVENNNRPLNQSTSEITQDVEMQTHPHPLSSLPEIGAMRVDVPDGEESDAHHDQHVTSREKPASQNPSEPLSKTYATTEASASSFEDSESVERESESPVLLIDAPRITTSMSTAPSTDGVESDRLSEDNLSEMSDAFEEYDPYFDALNVCSHGHIDIDSKAKSSSISS